MTSSTTITASPMVYTLGEPAGIGADIIIQLVQQRALPMLVCVGDKAHLQARAAQIGLPLILHDYPQRSDRQGSLSILHVPINNIESSGVADTANVEGVINMLDRAVDGCLSGEFSAMVTGPLHKGVINDAGVAFSGHTEYLATRCKAELPVMLLASDQLRVALATTHLPLKDVSAAITEDHLMHICRVLHHGLQQRYAIQKPRILVCGLNPHAGEDGHLGMEEIEVIIPALEKLRQEQINVVGPLPADTLFTDKNLQGADVVLAMYHDQGLPVLKALSFGRAANITLGLPIIRTSVDHGTAFDIAGSGKADISSLQVAIKVASDMVAANHD